MVIPKGAYRENGEWWIDYASRRQRWRLVVRTCRNCQQEFLSRNVLVGKNKGLFCTVRCACEHRNRTTSQPRGPESPAFAGERRELKSGYVLVWIPDNHPLAEMRQKNGRVLEHRLVMAMFLGRPLLPEEDVHHKNGKRDDNRLENLELWSRSHPSGQRVEDKLAWAKEIVALYEPKFGHVQLRAIA